MSREQVKKYFEVRFFSLAILAIGIFAVCIFLFFFFALRGQYVYAFAVIALAVVVLLAALELLGYVKSLKKPEKAGVQKTKTSSLYLCSVSVQRVSAFSRFLLAREYSRKDTANATMPKPTTTSVIVSSM